MLLMLKSESRRFLSLDLFLLLFWEVMLIPMAFLIGIWGHGRRIYAAINSFFIRWRSILMLVGIIGLQPRARSTSAS